MKATAIRVDVKEISNLERAVPAMAIVSASIKFQLTGNLSELNGSTEKIKEQQLGKLLLEALRNVNL